jgi:hypothetical protein
MHGGHGSHAGHNHGATDGPSRRQPPKEVTHEH